MERLVRCSFVFIDKKNHYSHYLTSKITFLKKTNYLNYFKYIGFNV